MKRKVCVWIAAVVLLTAAAGGFIFLQRRAGTEEVHLTNLQVCHRKNPLGMDEDAPTFSWQMASDRQGACQSAYRI